MPCYLINFQKIYRNYMTKDMNDFVSSSSWNLSNPFIFKRTSISKYNFKSFFFLCHVYSSSLSVKYRFLQLRQLNFYSLSFKRLFTLSTGNLSSISIISNKFSGNSFSSIRVRYSLTALRSIIIFP